MLVSGPARTHLERRQQFRIESRDRSRCSVGQVGLLRLQHVRRSAWRLEQQKREQAQSTETNRNLEV
jgi:hypothetical protein